MAKGQLTEKERERNEIEEIKRIRKANTNIGEKKRTKKTEIRKGEKGNEWRKKGKETKHRRN